MKLRVFKTIYPVVFYALVFAGLVLTSGAMRYVEKLGRGVVAVRISSGQVYVGWRMLGNEWGKNIGYHIYRDGVRITSSPITSSTNYIDITTVNSTYSVSPVIDGVEGIASSPAVSVWSTNYLTIPLQVPAGVTTPDGVTCTYRANDCSVGDLDGDGEYEIILKWDPSNSKDNSKSGYTGNVYLDAYEMDGTLIWRIDLGINIRAGAHYTQFMIYDLDSDGKAEIACKTAPYTKDGSGNYVLLSGDTLADYRNTSGYILSGPEYLTVFNGQTGAAMATTNYNPPRGTVSAWGDSYGNRVDRFLACVAYLDGTRPSLVMCRGYYTRAALVAWDWRDGQLTQRWIFDTGFSGGPWSAYKGQGNHNLSVGDVDGDGKDEIVYGACAIDDDGTGLYTTGLGHGDAIHLGDFDPDRPGLEVFDIHEPKGETVIGSEFRDAFTGEMIWGMTPGDVGRGCADDIYAGNPGGEMWSSNTGGLRDRYGNYIGRTPGSTNFLVWWDGDAVRELLNGSNNDMENQFAYDPPAVTTPPVIDKYGLSGDTRLLTATGCYSNNSTKATPCLSGDILGDWREEVIFRTSDNTALRIYTTTAITSSRLYTLMHDSQYRLSIAWQNVAYNQPPHTSFHLGNGMTPPPTPQIRFPKPLLYGDFTNDDKVDTDDLSYFINFWLASDCLETSALDLNEDCIINFFEFSAFAQNWSGPDTTPPSAPTGLSATAGDGTVTLDWKDNSESDFRGYNIYRSTTSGGDYVKLNASLLSSSDYTDADVANGTTYYYVVTAADTLLNESICSSEVSATPDVVFSITIQENSTGFCSVDGTIDSDNAGFTGTGFANTTNATGNGVNWSVSVPSAATYMLTWRYANGSTSRPGNLIVNGATVVSNINFPATGGWTTWVEVSVDVNLSAGVNSIRLEATSSNGLANIDYLMVTGAGPLPASCP